MPKLLLESLYEMIGIQDTFQEMSSRPCPVKDTPSFLRLCYPTLSLKRISMWIISKSGLNSNAGTLISPGPLMHILLIWDTANWNTEALTLKSRGCTMWLSTCPHQWSTFQRRSTTLHGSSSTSIFPFLLQQKIPFSSTNVPKMTESHIILYPTNEIKNCIPSINK